MVTFISSKQSPAKMANIYHHVIKTVSAVNVIKICLNLANTIP
jgi:hypothetical protein